MCFVDESNHSLAWCFQYLWISRRRGGNAEIKTRWEAEIKLSTKSWWQFTCMWRLWRKETSCLQYGSEVFCSWWVVDFYNFHILLKQTIHLLQQVMNELMNIWIWLPCIPFGWGNIIELRKNWKISILIGTMKNCFKKPEELLLRSISISFTMNGCQ